ncbi:putative E3 ubiquitin-protein ligase HERC4 [Nelusetta ayraudi]|uniref:putative E3 ubiquitin-protein ligase HERC4 n=1 Tax=Nelusetta ayraudi TaxID=303726 RepID=UPI003F6FAD4F
MLSWGQDSRRGFRVNDDTAADGVPVFFQPGYSVRELAASRGARAFVCGGGDAFMIRGDESDAGRTGTVKHKRVKGYKKIRAVSCGDETVVLLSEGGTLLCVDTNQTSLVPRTPLSSTKVAQIACGSQHVVALSEAGQVYAWGKNSRGQLGVGQWELCTSQPQHLRSMSLIPLVQIAAGGEQSFALSLSGGVFGWGRNDCGQLGLGNRTDQHVPTTIDCLIMKKTVHISCGRDHTVILTKDGVVFTFGSGQYGQLGHNSLNDELRPRLVAELWRATVTKIACGWYHTLVMTDRKKLYSFGRNTHGQLGRGEESHPSVPLPVHLPQDACNGRVVRKIFSGGNCSFVTCLSMKKANKEASVDNATPQLHALIDKWVSQYDSKSRTTIEQEIRSTFCSASYLNQCFLDQRKDKHFGTSPKCCGLNLQLVQGAFEKLAKNAHLLSEVVAAALQVLHSLDESPAGVEGLRIFLLLTELLHVTQRSKDLTQWIELTDKTAAAIQRLSDRDKQVIGDWWYSQNPTIMQRHLQVWKVVVYRRPTFPYSSTIKNVLRILECMYKVNSQTTGRPRIPEKKFAMEIPLWTIAQELTFWNSAEEHDIDDEDFILFNYTFLMDLRSKKTAFDMFAQFTKAQFIIPECLELHLRRSALVEDAFAQLAAVDPCNYNKPLMVFLDANTERSLIYQKDLFHRLFDKLVSTNPEMFQFNDAKTLAWFPTTVTPEDRKTFYLFGVLCGLALYNRNVIQLPFPLALFKKLVDAKPTLDDMKEFQPSVGRSLEEVLNYDDDLVANLYLDFTIKWDGKEATLDPQNPEKEVTSQNKKEFVDAYVNHVFNTSVQDVFQEFESGFFEVCDSDLVGLFRPEELQDVLVGKDVYDWNKLKQNTLYGFNCDADHPIILTFWEVFDELTEDEKMDFVWFVTGFRKIPVFGIQIQIRPKLILHGSPDEYFPTTLTCHSILELPGYSKKKIMRNKLKAALNSERVFYGMASESES